MGEKFNEKKCFIITPIGGDKTDIRRSADGVINSVIRPLLESNFKFADVKAAHEINSSGSINNQIMNRILEDDLVIANLSGVNPNVMYEIAVRHATMKPIIHICEEGTKLPFDIIDQRTIFYKNDMLGVSELSSKLKNMIEETIKIDENRDNPIYNAAKAKIYQETIINNPDKNLEKYLLERFDKLETKLEGRIPKTYSGKATYKYTENFDIKIKVLAEDLDFDKENFYLEFKAGIEKKLFELLLFKIMKEETIDNEKIICFMTSIGSDKNVPYTEPIEQIIKNLKYSKVEILEIEGNELPF